MPQFLGAENGVVPRFLPRWQGVPKIAIESWEYHGGKGDFPFLPSFYFDLDIELKSSAKSIAARLRKIK